MQARLTTIPIERNRCRPAVSAAVLSLLAALLALYAVAALLGIALSAGAPWWRSMA